MSTHYNAFISYKHAELDNRVAEDIQHCLERFAVPYAIKKKTDKKKIERIFRDKDELPITSDLTSNISDALENSEYLIVICSPNTAKSTWVKREIAYFLKNHTKNQILTVLAGGESQDVIPEELRHKEETITDDNGEEHTITVPVEPLACDYRMSFRRAHKEEIPRLAAVLLGCSYDELVRRQRQYKMRQLGISVSVAFALSLAFGGYMMYSKMQIDKNYQEALINQSRFLANESIRLYDNNQRVDALHLALASLPKSGNDRRPVTTESIKALINATGAYSSPIANVSFIWDFEMNDIIKSFTVSKSGNYLASRDVNNCVMVWDAVDHKRLLNKSYNNIVGMEFIDNDVLIIWENKTIYCISFPDGNEKWSFTISDEGASFDSNWGFLHVLEVGDGTIILPTNAKNTIYQFNANSGERKDTIKALTDVTSIWRYAISPDNKKLAIDGWHNNMRELIIYDFSNQKTICTELKDYSMSLAWGDNDHILLEYGEDLYPYTGRIDDVTWSTNEIHCIQCFNASDLSEAWSTKITARGGMISSGFEIIPNTGNVVCYIGDAANVYNVNTGQQLYGGYACGNILCTTIQQSTTYYVTDSGDFGQMLPEKSKDLFVSVRPFPNDLDKVFWSDGFFVHRRNGTSILYFSENQGDENWTRMNRQNNYPTNSQKVINDSFMAILYQETNKTIKLDVYDLKTCSFTETYTLSENGSIYDYHLLDISNNKVYLSFTQNKPIVLISVDITEKEVITKDLNRNTLSSYNSLSMKNNKIAFFEIDSVIEKSYILNILNANDNSKYTLNMRFDAASYNNITYLPISNYVFYSDEKNCFFIDTNSNIVKNLDAFSSFDYTPVVCENDSGSLFAVGDGESLNILDKNLRVINNIDCTGNRIIGLSFHRINSFKFDTLFVAFQSGEVRLFNLLTGEVIKSACFDMVTDPYETERVEFIFDDKNMAMYIQMKKALSIIDMNSWLQYAFISGCIGYSNAADKFIVNRIVEVDNGTIYHSYYQIMGYLPHYSVDDLKKKANKLLNGQEMSKEMKMQYGISE